MGEFTAATILYIQFGACNKHGEKDGDEWTIYSCSKVHASRNKSLYFIAMEAMIPSFTVAILWVTFTNYRTSSAPAFIHPVPHRMGGDAAMLYSIQLHPALARMHPYCPNHYTAFKPISFQRSPNTFPCSQIIALETATIPNRTIFLTPTHHSDALATCTALRHPTVSSSPCSSLNPHPNLNYSSSPSPPSFPMNSSGIAPHQNHHRPQTALSPMTGGQTRSSPH